MYRIALAAGHEDLSNRIHNLKNVEILEEDDDIDVIEDVLHYVKCDYVIVNVMLNQDKALKLAMTAQKTGIRVVALIPDKKSLKTEIAALVGAGVYAFVPFDDLNQVMDFMASYPASYDFRELAAVEKDSEKVLSPSLQRRKTSIAILGTMSRIGTTTQTLALTSYLNQCGYKAAYIESNTSGFVRAALDAYSDAKESSPGKVICGGLPLFYDAAAALNDPYQFYIYDFGSIQSAQELSWIDKDVKVLVCGAKPSELSMFQEAMPLIYRHSPKYIFSFVAESDRRSLLELMGESAGSVYFAQYMPDPFERYDESYFAAIAGVIPTQTENVAKRTGFWRKGRKK